METRASTRRKTTSVTSQSKGRIRKKAAVRTQSRRRKQEALQTALLPGPKASRKSTSEPTAEPTLTKCSTSHEYRQLDSVKDQIRILTLLPGERDDAIETTLSVACLDDNPYYEALSYVWGDARPEYCRWIRVDGQKRLVTQNLWAALSHLRERDKERRLWVDALCINQVDEAEKSHQVALMSQIYSNTAMGLAWLGDFESDAADAHATRKASKATSAAMNNTIPRADVEQALLLIHKLERKSKDGHFTTKENEALSGWVHVVQREVDGLEKLVSLDWWRRIWTAQETVLPPRLKLICGSLEWAYQNNYNEIGLHTSSQQCCERTGYQVPNLWRVIERYDHDLRSVRKLHRPLSLNHAVILFRHRHSRDPRDKIFALLGMVHPIARHFLDYSLSKREVYTRFTRYSIIADNNLVSLLRFRENDRDSNLPSWVPDLATTVEPMTADIDGRHILSEYFTFHASNGRLLDVSVSQEDELNIVGIETDRIKTTSADLGLSASDGRFVREMVALWRGLLERDPELDLERYPGGETSSYDQAFLRTCRMDLFQIPEGVRRLELGCDRTMFHGHLHGTISMKNRFFITCGGRIGIGPAEIQVGDVIYILSGGNMPFILREYEDGVVPRRYTYVGHSYVHGIMDGEAISGDFQWKRITIV